MNENYEIYTTSMLARINSQNHAIMHMLCDIISKRDGIEFKTLLAKYLKQVDEETSQISSSYDKSKS